MTEILTEPSSQREDNKVWRWRYGDPVNTPVKVSFINKSNNEKYADVPGGYYARFIVKTDLREDEVFFERNFEFSTDGVFIVELTAEEVCQFRAGATYYCGFALYDSNGKFIRTLVQDLPLVIDKSVFSKQLYF